MVGIEEGVRLDKTAGCPAVAVTAATAEGNWGSGVQLTSVRSTQLPSQRKKSCLVIKGLSACKIGIGLDLSILWSGLYLEKFFRKTLPSPVPAHFPDNKTLINKLYPAGLWSV